MRKYIYIIIISLIVISCENEIPFNIKENQPKLIVNALFDASKEKNEITLGLTGRDRASYIDDASIDIYVNGILQDHIAEPKPANPNGIDNYKYETGVRFSPDDVIELEVKTNDGKHFAQSKIIVPHPIQIERVDTTMYSENSWYYSDDKFIRVKTTFSDNGEKKNYYRIAMDLNFEIEIEDTVTHEKRIRYEPIRETLIIREDVVLTDGRPSTEDDEDNILFVPVQNHYGVFDNSRINGTYTMTTSLRIPYSSIFFLEVDNNESIIRIGGNVRVRLLSISEMQYFYLKALNIYDSVDYDDYLSLPIKFPSNIEGGTGIFGVCTGNEVTIPLKDYITTSI